MYAVIHLRLNRAILEKLIALERLSPDADHPDDASNAIIGLISDLPIPAPEAIHAGAR